MLRGVTSKKSLGVQADTKHSGGRPIVSISRICALMIRRRLCSYFLLQLARTGLLRWKDILRHVIKIPRLRLELYRLKNLQRSGPISMKKMISILAHRCGRMKENYGLNG